MKDIRFLVITACLMIAGWNTYARQITGPLVASPVTPVFHMRQGQYIRLDQSLPFDISQDMPVVVPLSGMSSYVLHCANTKDGTRVYTGRVSRTSDLFRKDDWRSQKTLFPRGYRIASSLLASTGIFHDNNAVFRQIWTSGWVMISSKTPLRDCTLHRLSKRPGPVMSMSLTGQAEKSAKVMNSLSGEQAVKIISLSKGLPRAVAADNLTPKERRDVAALILPAYKALTDRVPVTADQPFYPVLPRLTGQAYSAGESIQIQGPGLFRVIFYPRLQPDSGWQAVCTRVAGKCLYSPTRPMTAPTLSVPPGPFVQIRKNSQAIGQAVSLMYVVPADKALTFSIKKSGWLRIERVQPKWGFKRQRVTTGRMLIVYSPYPDVEAPQNRAVVRDPVLAGFLRKSGPVPEQGVKTKLMVSLQNTRWEGLTPDDPLIKRVTKPIPIENPPVNPLQFVWMPIEKSMEVPAKGRLTLYATRQGPGLCALDINGHAFTAPVLNGPARLDFAMREDIARIIGTTKNCVLWYRKQGTSVPKQDIEKAMVIKTMWVLEPGQEAGFTIPDSGRPGLLRLETDSKADQRPANRQLIEKHDFLGMPIIPKGFTFRKLPQKIQLSRQTGTIVFECPAHRNIIRLENTSDRPVRVALSLKTSHWKLPPQAPAIEITPILGFLKRLVKTKKLYKLLDETRAVIRQKHQGKIRTQALLLHALLAAEAGMFRLAKEAIFMAGQNIDSRECRSGRPCQAIDSANNTLKTVKFLSSVKRELANIAGPVTFDAIPGRVRDKALLEGVKGLIINGNYADAQWKLTGRLNKDMPDAWAVMLYGLAGKNGDYGVVARALERLEHGGRDFRTRAWWLMMVNRFYYAQGYIPEALRNKAVVTAMKLYKTFGRPFDRMTVPAWNNTKWAWVQPVAGVFDWARPPARLPEPVFSRGKDRDSFLWGTGWSQGSFIRMRPGSTSIFQVNINTRQEVALRVAFRQHPGPLGRAGRCLVRLTANNRTVVIRAGKEVMVPLETISKAIVLSPGRYSLGMEMQCAGDALPTTARVQVIFRRKMPGMEKIVLNRLPWQGPAYVLSTAQPWVSAGPRANAIFQVTRGGLIRMLWTGAGEATVIETCADKKGGFVHHPTKKDHGVFAMICKSGAKLDARVSRPAKMAMWVRVADTDTIRTGLNTRPVTPVKEPVKEGRGKPWLRLRGNPDKDLNLRVSAGVFAGTDALHFEDWTPKHRPWIFGPRAGFAGCTTHGICWNIRTSARFRQEGSPAWTLYAGLAFQSDFGLFMKYATKVAIQNTERGIGFSVFNDLKAGWQIPAGGFTVIRPWLRVFYNKFSLAGAKRPDWRSTDGLLYNITNIDHFRGMEPGLSVAVRPFYELLLDAGLSVMTNQDFTSPDRVDLRLAAHVGLPRAVISPFAALSYRLRDDERSTRILRFTAGAKASYMLRFSDHWAGMFSVSGSYTPDLNSYTLRAGIDFLYFRDHAGFSGRGWWYPLNGFYGLGPGQLDIEEVR